LRDYKKEYQRGLQLHPNYSKENYQRTLDLHPDHRKWLIKFKHKLIYLGFNVLTEKCSKCKKTVKNGEIKRTVLHHDIYNWNDILANTRELCTSCHNKFRSGVPCPICHRTLPNTRPETPEINRPKTESEMKVWNQISWFNFYKLKKEKDL